MGLAIAGLLGVLTTLPERAGSDAGTYATQRRQIRVGIIATRALNMPNGEGSENPDPHVFYVLDSRTDLKPNGLEFVNPLAPPTITGSIYERWRKRSRGNDPAFIPGNPMSELFRVGARVTKNMGAYWEVNIDSLESSDLQQFDLLYMHTHKPDVALPADIREKLRAYMDGGGTLWVEQCGGFTFNRYAPFFFDAQWRSGGPAGGPGQPGAVIGAANHPLITAPYVLSPEEVRTLGDKNVGGWYIYNPYDPNDPGYYDPTAGRNELNPPGRETLVPVVWNTRGYGAAAGGAPNPNWRPYVLAGIVGSGKLILSAQDTGCAINDYVGGVQVGFGGNCGAISGQNLLAAKPQDLKFAYNLATWAVAHRTAYADTRRTSSASESVGLALDDKWSAPGSGTARVGGAVFYKGCIYAVGGDLVLRCFDANPAQDLDGDGNPDEGLVDFNAGASYDAIWALDLKQFAGGAPLTGASTPTIIEFFDGNAPSAGGLLTLPNRELVVVTLSNGAVVAARALPQTLRTVNGAQTYAALADFTNVDWVVTPAQTGAREFALAGTDPIPAPAFSEGVVFVALNTDAGGRILAIDPFSGGSPFHVGRPAGLGEGLVPDVPGTEALRGSLTVGYVRDTLTGATDKVIYINVSPKTGQPASVRAFPFSAKGEPLTLVSAPDRLFRSRARSPWYIYLGPGENAFLRPRVTCIYRDPTDGTYGSRELQYTAADPPGNNQWHERFDQGEARVKVGAAIELMNVERPDGTRVGLRTVTPTDPNVTIVADYVYDWAPPVGSTFPKVNARSVFVAPDPTDTNNYISGTAALGRNDMLFFAANATNDAATYPGRGVLIAANEQSANRSQVRWTYALYDAFEMKVNGTPMTVPPRLRRSNGAFLVNMRFIGTPAVRDETVYAVASGTAAGGQAVSVLLAFRAEQDFVLRLNTRIETGARVRVRQPNLFVDRNAQPEAWIELAAGQYTVDYDSGLIRVTAMAPPGAIAAAYASASVPFVVQVGNGPEQVTFPTRADLDGVRRGGPDGVDNLLWFCVLPASAASGPSVQGDSVWVGLADGSVVSVDADPSARNPETQAVGSEVAYRWVSAPLVVPGDPNPARPVIAPPTAVNGVLAVATGSGVFAKEDTVTLIADASRLLEVNSAGDAVWWCDGTRTFDIVNGVLTDYTDPGNPIVGTGLPAGQRVPFRRPAVARRMGGGDILVVDTGNNRVVAIDRGGYTKWEVNRIQDDYKHLLRPGDPLSLNEPTDCTFWTEFQPNLNISGGSYNYQGPGYVIHYLIADSGNYRIVELIDVYQANGQRVMVRQLNFVTSTLAKQGKRYRYRAVQRLVMRNSDLPASPASWRENPYDPSAPPLELRYLTMATVSNARMVDPNMPLTATLGSGESLETGGGSVALLKETGDPLAVVTNLRIPVLDGANLTVRVQPIVNPTWFSSFHEAEGGQVVVKFLLADANGVYQARLNFIDHADSSPPYVEPVLDVEWLLTAEDYYAMTGKRLQATGVTRLSASADNPGFPSLRQFVIANRFSGEDNPSVFGAAVNVTGSGEFHGEVFTIKPATFNYGPGHGYIPDYSVIGSPVGGFLWPNDGGTYVINGVARQMPQASIIRRTPNESVPRPPYAVLHRPGDTDAAFAGDPPGAIRRSIGDPARGTSTSVLEQPSFADRPL
jgi:hypothetical protein